MIRRPPRSTRTDTLLPYTTLFRSQRLERWPVQHEITVAIGQIALDLGITLARGNLRVNLPAQVVRQLCTGIGDGLVLAHQAAQFMRQRFIALLLGDRKSTRLNSSH